ncbi:MAG: NAD(P)H-dependent oxidoreductase [Flavobacteriales bacterium]
MNLIENLKWRYAVKKMDVTQKVSPEDITLIKEATQLSASSYGFQPYKILDIRDTYIRKKLLPMCFNQSQVTDASHLFVFCNKIVLLDSDVDQLMQLNSKIRGVDIEQLSAYGDIIKSKLKGKSKDDIFHWTAKQTYIALANALTACAELKIDSTPMEGFEADKVNDLLHLNSQGLNACVLLTIGYRSNEDATQYSNKVRFPISDLFNEI